MFHSGNVSRRIYDRECEDEKSKTKWNWQWIFRAKASTKRNTGLQIFQLPHSLSFFLSIGIYRVNRIFLKLSTSYTGILIALSHHIRSFESREATGWGIFVSRTWKMNSLKIADRNNFSEESLTCFFIVLNRKSTLRSS